MLLPIPKGVKTLGTYLESEIELMTVSNSCDLVFFSKGDNIVINQDASTIEVVVINQFSICISLYKISGICWNWV